MDSDETPQDQPEKPGKPIMVANNAAVILEARAFAQELKEPRRDAKIWHLPDDHFTQIVEWLIAGFPSKIIEALCKKELRLPPAKVPGRQSQSIFWQEFRPYWLSARRRSNRRTVQAIGKEIEEAPLNVDEVLKDEIKQRAWEWLQEPNPPEKLVKTFVNAVLKMRDQDDRAEDRKLDREKFASAQRSKIEEGLEALRAEIANNPGAMAAWQQLKTLLVPA